AYAAGTIELGRPDAKTPKSQIRHAPSFVVGCALEPNAHRPYTAETIQKFLGFDEQTGLVRIKDTLNALALLEQGVLRQSARQLQANGLIASRRSSSIAGVAITSHGAPSTMISASAATLSVLNIINAHARHTGAAVTGLAAKFQTAKPQP